MDREKVIKGLECCTKLGCHHGCEYKSNGYSAMTCRQELEKDALELLKEQKQLVRCKDCKYFLAERGECLRHHFVIYFSNGNWFCADGVPNET